MIYYSQGLSLPTAASACAVAMRCCNDCQTKFVASTVPVSRTAGQEHFFQACEDDMHTAEMAHSGVCKGENNGTLPRSGARKFAQEAPLMAIELLASCLTCHSPNLTALHGQRCSKIDSDIDRPCWIAARCRPALHVHPLAVSPHQCLHRFVDLRGANRASEGPVQQVYVPALKIHKGQHCSRLGRTVSCRPLQTTLSPGWPLLKCNRPTKTPSGGGRSRALMRRVCKHMMHRRCTFGPITMGRTVPLMVLQAAAETRTW